VKGPPPLNRARGVESIEGAMRTAGTRLDWPWRPFACFVALGVFWGSWGALLPSIQEQTGATDADLGLALLVLASAALPAMLSSGWIIDRLGDRALAPVTGGFGVAAFIPALAHSPVALGAAVVALGAASGTLDVTMNAAVAAEEERRGRRLMHAAHALFSIGVVVSGGLVGLARAAGADPVAVLGVVASVLLAIAAAIAVRRPGHGGRAVHATVRPTGRRLMISAPLLMLGGLCALAFVVEGALQSWSAIHLEDTLGAGPAVGGLGPATFAAAMALGRLGAQGLADRTPDRLLLGSAAGLCAIGTAVAAFAPSAPVALAGMFVSGAGISVAAPTLFGLGGRIVPGSERGRALASVTTVAYLGFLLGPSMVGALAGATSLRWGLAAAAAVAVVLAGTARFAPVSPPLSVGTDAGGPE